MSLPPGFDIGVYVADYMALGSLLVSIVAVLTTLALIRKSAKNI